ncbi:tetratricopeptide repeat protein [Bradyrhizobium sp. SYSU BS000235]|uniref:tetratricopeptide repeat protein n=1 Tax=Bradyrhizobium sp. SYSU BS000235 TaxID=3411332 RepID=UPI003C7893D9
MVGAWNSAERTGRKLISLRVLVSWIALSFLSAATIGIAHAGDLARSNAAYARRDYVRAAKALSHAARRGNREAQGRLGFMYENGLGVPQAYDAAASLYIDGARQGDPFAQSRLGLMYDKGHGVPQDFVLAYKWLNLAAGRASRRERDFFLRLRDAVSSKMTPDQILEGQRMALDWRPGEW